MIRESLQKLHIDRLSEYIDFPSPIQVITVPNCQYEFKIAQQE